MTDVLPHRRVAFRTNINEDSRLRLSAARLSRDDYAAESVIAETTGSDWPGDLAGRLLLTLTRLAGAEHESLERVTELFEAMTSATAELGYFGSPLGDIVDEQQVACHGWVASAYLQYGFLTNDPRAFVAAERVIDGLLLPAISRFGSYPVGRVAAVDGAPSGTATEVMNNWLVSTDTWCILLALNGLVPYLEYERREDIIGACDTLISSLGALDLIGVGVQLHAALAAARNAAHFAELTGSTAAEAVAKKVYETYSLQARTLNWATYNWFGREDSWTEPCAIVDSVGLGFALWRLTRDPAYIRDVALIETNGMAFAQKHGGGFGLDSIATLVEPTIRVIHEDARWCCTVRGALGLIDLRNRSAAWTESGIEVLLPRAGRMVGEGARSGWTVRFSDPDEYGRFELTVVDAPPSAAPLVIDGPRLEEAMVLDARQGASIVARVVRESFDVLLASGDRMVVAADRVMAHVGDTVMPLGDLGPLVRKDDDVNLALGAPLPAMFD